MDLQSLHQPLLPSTAVTVSTTTTSVAISTSSTWSIIFRLLSVLLIGLISIYANHEASKGFDLTIINDAGDTLSGRRFGLFFVSNDKLSRLILNANKSVQNILSLEHTEHKNPIRRVTVRFTSQNLTQIVTVHPNCGHEFVINICSSVMEEHDVPLAMARKIQLAMARIWLWNIGHDQTDGEALSHVLTSLKSHIQTSTNTSVWEEV